MKYKQTSILGYTTVLMLRSPMLLTNLDRVNIHSILEPPLIVGDLHIVATHLPLLHSAVLCKRPILKTIASIPLSALVMPLIPELDSDLLHVSLSVK